MFKYIIKPIILLKISSEEFVHRHEFNRKNVEGKTADALTGLMILIETLVICFIAYFYGPLHISFAKAFIFVAAIVFSNIKIANRILHSKKYAHKLTELYSYYALLPLNQRKYYHSWRYSLTKVFPVFAITVGSLIIGLLIIPIIFPR